MSCDQNYPFPQVFLVDGGGNEQRSGQPPSLVPCWSFPPAQERVRSRGKSHGFMGVSPSLAMIVLLLFLLVFAALGFEAYQIYNMQRELKDLRKGKSETEMNTPQKQIGFYDPELYGEKVKTAAHVIGRFDVKENNVHKTLHWEQHAGRAYVSGGVTYKVEDGGLQVNKSGLYHIYSRVELIFKNCDITSSFVHSVFVRREQHSSPLNLMEAHRAGFCSQQLKNPWTTESYLGSALELQKNDKVFVNVSHPNLISHAHYANFFGLYKI